MAHKNLVVFFLLLSLFACNDGFKGNSLMVSNSDELQSAITNVQPGDEIVLANGVWKDVEIKFTSTGTPEKPIVLRAETPGEVSIEGQSFLQFSGEYLEVKQLIFKNGFTPSNAVVEFRIGSKVANHCKLTNCVIDNFNQPKRDRADHWVEFWGRHNELSSCNIIGKSNSGPTVRVQIKGNESIKNFHRIVNNHFGPRPRKGGPHGETLQIGDSGTSMSPSNTFVANNLFDECNGEVEVISSKTNFNEFRNNVFYKCEGSLVMRHGNYCIIDGNYFIGDDDSDNIGGIRIVNTGHWITNNYFYNLKGTNFRSALAIMNGIPKSPLNRYNQVTDIVVAHNTWVNCNSPLQFSVGTNVSQKDVLPLSEIRSARPVRSLVANNVIYNEKGDKMPIVAYEKVDGVKFISNYINNQGVEFQMYEGLEISSIELQSVSENVSVPVANMEKFQLYKGFDFETITSDIFGNPRSENNCVGAICDVAASDPTILDHSKYGADWYSDEEAENESKVYSASADEGDLAAKISNANNGDVVELSAGTYTISKSVVINKKITLRSKNKETKATIIYKGDSNSAAFEMHPNGNLSINDVDLKGGKEQYAFACLKENMSSLYNLSVKGCEISAFNYVLKAYKESFADEIVFENSVIKNCENGIELSEETNDKGDYNVEFLTINNCEFVNVKSNVIDYYRGGYDESTIGGNLLVTNSTFKNCGANEENRILINTRGIVNVDISNNTFRNNPVNVVALLWGAKNNRHHDNEIVNSGKMVVQENIKLKLMY